MTSAVRYCMRCGSRLTRDSRASMCAPCRQLSGIGSDHAPDLGADFWYTDRMRDAFASRDMGPLYERTDITRHMGTRHFLRRS
jgi:hypothetical protein